MIDQLSHLTNKTNELESIIQNLSENQKYNESQTNCLSYLRNFSSLEIIVPKKILIARIEPKQNQNILFQCQLDLNLASEESVEISFIANGFEIYKTYKILPEGSSQISIMQNFKPLTTEKFSVFVEIKPISQKPIVLTSISLFVWGNLSDNNSTDYQSIVVDDKYLISVLDNSCIYSLLIDKEVGEFNLVDFDYVDSAISHKYLYDSTNNIVYLFRVDLSGNLFYKNISSGNEIFLASDVSCVSADISTQGKILVSYVKNSECYYFEISTSGICSIHRKLYANSISVGKVLCHYNPFRNKFILVMSTSSFNNYLVEQIDENFSNSDTVTCQYGLYITTESNNN